MLTRVLAATVVGAIAMFLLGFLIYGLALDPYFKANMIQYAGLMKDPPNFVLLGLSNLVSAFLFAFIFDNWARARSFGAGLKAGAIIMFLTAVTLDLQFLSFMNMWKPEAGFMPVILDIVAATVLGGLSGGVIGLVLGAMNKGAAAEA